MKNFGKDNESDNDGLILLINNLQRQDKGMIILINNLI